MCFHPLISVKYEKNRFEMIGDLVYQVVDNILWNAPKIHCKKKNSSFYDFSAFFSDWECSKKIYFQKVDWKCKKLRSYGIL